MSLAIATHPTAHATTAHVATAQATTHHATTAQRKSSTCGRPRGYVTMTILSGMTLAVAWTQHALLTQTNTSAVFVGLSASELLVVVLLITASYTDMRWQKIYNWSIYPVLAWSAVIACLHSLGLHMEVGPQRLPVEVLGSLGITEFAIGTMGCGFVMLVPYRMAHGGAGDVKLAMALGGLLGFLPALVGIAFGYILAAGYVLAASLVRADLRSLIPTLARMLGHRCVHSGIAPPSPARAAALQQPIPLAGFFAMGVVISQCL